MKLRRKVLAAVSLPWLSWRQSFWPDAPPNQRRAMP